MESHLFMVNIKNGEINFFLTIRTRVSLKNDEANCVVVLRDFFSELAFGKSISSNFSDKHLIDVTWNVCRYSYFISVGLL